MQTKPTISDLLNRWPTRRAVHEDARAAEPNLDPVAVHRWFQRGSFPPKFDAALLRGAERRGIGLHPMEIANARAAGGDHPPAHRGDTPSLQDAPETRPSTVAGGRG